MGYPEKRGSYWRARYKIAPGKYGTVCDGNGATIKFPAKRAAKKAADDAEAAVRQGTWRDVSLGRITFGEYVNEWFAGQDLAASTMQSYRRYIESHLMPEFEETALADIRTTTVDAWAKRERETYAPTSVRTWRAVLHLILADAVDEGLITANPAAKRRGRGKRAGRSQDRGPEKVVLSPLQTLLLAERASLLSGRDDEFVGCTVKRYTGMRWGEVVGLETEFVRERSIRVEHQLYELDNGEFIRCPPKDDSYRTIDIPPWLGALMREHMARVQLKPCSCHGERYVFRGLAAAGTSRPGAKVVDVARRAGVSTGTVSNVANHSNRVAPDTRARVEAAMTELGFVRHWRRTEYADHWRRNGYRTWVFHPAATGWYPKKAPYPERVVPIIGGPWPGIPARGRNAAQRADSCWTAIARGHTPHGERHSHRTDMEELRTEKVLMDERMGHADGSVSARYSHVTDRMRQRLMGGLTQLWDEALTARYAMHPNSPVEALDRLLRKLD